VRNDANLVCGPKLPMQSQVPTSTTPTVIPTPKRRKISDHAKYYEDLYPHASPQDVLSFVTAVVNGQIAGS